MARILVTGSRTFADPLAVKASLRAAQQLVYAPETPVVVHGAARGLDTMAAEAALEFGWAAESHPAAWSTHAGCWCKDQSRRCGFAGHRRNAEMVALGADIVLAYPTHTQNDTTGSRGTWNCAKSAQDAGLAVLVVWGDRLFPFGQAGAELLLQQAIRTAIRVGSRSEMSISDAQVAF